MYHVAFHISMVVTSSPFCDIRQFCRTVAGYAPVDPFGCLFQNDSVHEWLSTDTQCEVF